MRHRAAQVAHPTRTTVIMKRGRSRDWRRNRAGGLFIPAGWFYSGGVGQRVPATAKGEATGAYLLRTAAQVFGERGYTATTQNDLIAAAGLTKGAFYFYFRSKADLALAVLQAQQ